MKIGFVSNCYAPRTIGGAELIMQAQAQSCRDAGHEVFVITLSPEGGAVKDAVEDVPVYRLPTRNSYWPFAPIEQRTGPRKAVFHVRDSYNAPAARDFMAVIELELPDVVVTHNLCGFSVALWSYLQERAIPVVHVLHDYYLMCPNTTRYHNGADCGCACSILSLPKRRASGAVSAVVGVSQYVLEQHLARGYFPRAIHQVIYNGRALLGGERRLKTNRGPLRIGFLGRVEHVKGIEVLLQALNADRGLPIQLQVGGRGEPGYLAYLQQKYPDPRVSYLGYVNAADFYRGLDVIVVPSLWHEPLPGVVYEPWEYGIPVIASQVGGIPEMINAAGIGWLVAPGDSGALLVALQNVVRLGDELDEYVEPLKRIRESYLPQRASRSLLEVVTSVVPA